MRFLPEQWSNTWISPTSKYLSVMTRRAISKRQQTGYSRRKKRRVRKCSSCKLLKTMSFYKPIILNGKKVMPKTCQTCRDKRTQYYWSMVISAFCNVAYESKHPRDASPSLDTLSSSQRSSSLDLSAEERDSYESTSPSKEVIVCSGTNDYPDISLPPYPVYQSVSSDSESPIPLCNSDQFCPSVDVYAKESVFEYFMNDYPMENSFYLTNDMY